MISHIALALAIVLLDTPTPTPTPGPGNSPISSFYVPPQQPPWAVPILPTWGTGTPQSTVWAATPAHGTDYPNQMATATAQLDVFLGPINSVSTPISGVMAARPTQTGDEISTGLDPLGTGVITFASLTDTLSADVVDMAGTAKGFISGVVDLGVYSPWMAPIPIILITSMVLSMFIPLIAMIIKAGTWLFNLLTKIATILKLVRG